MTSNGSDFCFSVSNCQDELILNGLLFLTIRTKKLTSFHLDSIIQNGGDINAKDANDSNNTPLHVAAIVGHPGIVRLLLDKGAKVSEKNSSGRTPLDIAQGSEVVNILQDYPQPVELEFRSSPESNQPLPQHSTTATKPISYAKRSGTSGLGGQLFETKLLTLILFRALNSEDVVEFYLGSNVDGLGALDDVVFWFRDGDGKTRMKFIQAKHRDEPERDGKFTLGEILKDKGDFSIHKYFNSYLSIRCKFGSKSENDPIFKEEFGKLDCGFVLYTPARENFERKQSLDRANAEFSTSQNDLLHSTDRGKTFKFDYSPKHESILVEVAIKFRLQSLGRSLTDFILSGRTENMMSDNLIQIYHVVLVRKLFKISEKGQTNFKIDFFETNEKSIVILREAMYDKVLEKRKKAIKESDLQIYTNAFLADPSAESISKLLGNVIKYDSSSNTLSMIKTRVGSDEFQNALRNTTVTPEIIRKATEIVGRTTLEPLNVKLPANFGNLDFPVRKNKQEQRLKHLVQRFKNLFELAAEHEHIVRIDDSMIGPGKILNHGDVGLNGGFAGMVGNILILDPKAKLLKLNCDENCLQPNAKMLLEMLKSEVGDGLEKYRFDIATESFPRLKLESNKRDEESVKSFLDNLVFYTNQAKENEVEEILKGEIKTRYKISDDTECDAVFLIVHNKVQHLWKQPKEAPFLTKSCDYFDKAVAQVRDNPPLVNLSAICTSQINRYQVEFNAASVEAIASRIKEGSITNIVSSQVEQCCIKLLQHFSAGSCLFVRAQYIEYALPYLREMLQLKTGSDFWQTLVVIGGKESIDGIKEIINGFEKSQKKLIVVTEEQLFLCDNTINDEGDGFGSLSEDSQAKLLGEREIYFQGIKIKLNQLVDDKLLGIVDAEMLSVLISNQKLAIGKGYESTRYKNIAKFLMQRKLKRPVIKVKKSVENTENDVWVYSSEEFSRKCIENKRTNVHWEDNQGIWQKSRGSLNKVRQLTDSSYSSQGNLKFTEETLDSLDERVVIVAAEPGMGKSTLMTELMERIKLKDPLSWVVRIDLLMFSGEFSKWRESADVSLVLNFLLNVQNILPTDNENVLALSPSKSIVIDTSRNKVSGTKLFEIELFLNYYNQGKLVFIFDGFDEINPDYKVQVLSLLNILQNHNTNKLWVTTRNDNNHYELEDSLGTFSYTLESFSRQDQVTYLQKYWASILMENTIDKARFEVIFDKLIKLLSKSINDTEASFMEIPLQIEMIARIFQASFKQYYGGKPIEELEYSEIDVVMLYDEFFRIKFDEILYTDKAPNMNKSYPKISQLIEKDRQSNMDKHEKLALRALFDERELKLILSAEDLKDVNSKYLIDHIKSGQEKVGLICGIVNGKPRFVHQTFAEFFAARYLWRLFKKSSNLDIDSLLQILTKSNRYQVCYFIQQIALKDINGRTNLNNLESKLCILLTKLVPYVRNYSYLIRNGSLQSVKQNHYSFNEAVIQSAWGEYVANRCARILLKIIDTFIANHDYRASLSIKSLDTTQRFQLLSTAASEGYYNLVQQFTKFLEPNIFCMHLFRNGWLFDPLLTAAANGHVKVVNVLKKEFYPDVTTWVDQRGQSLIQHIFSNFPVYQFHFVRILVQTAIIDGSPYQDSRIKGEMFPLLNLLFEQAPLDVVRLVAQITDFDRLNKFKILEQDGLVQDATHGLEQDATHGLFLCMLAYNDQLISELQNYGADFSQSVNSLMSQYCCRAVTETELCPTKLDLNDIYQRCDIWNNLLPKIKMILKIGTGYNRKDSLYDASTRQFIEQAYYIHTILKKMCDEIQLTDMFDTLLKLIIICLKRHTTYKESTYISVINSLVALASPEFNKKYRTVFGSTATLVLYPAIVTKRFVIRECTILLFKHIVEKYKETLQKGEFPFNIYVDETIGNEEKNDVLQRIHNIVNFQNDHNLTFDEALLLVSQEMQRSNRILTMMETSEVKEIKDVKIFETEQIFDVLELQEVKTTKEMENLMTRIIDCNGLSLISTLLHHVSFDQEECIKKEKKFGDENNTFIVGRTPKRFVKDVIAFTEQAPQIYNLWMHLDQQYRQLLQAIHQTNIETVRTALSQIDLDYRRAVINGQDPEYGSPLHYAAAARGDLELVRTLLESGADPNSRLDETGSVQRLRIDSDEMDNFKHFTPLHFAAMRGYGEIVKILLENGAKTDGLTHSGWLPVGLARKSGHESIVKLFAGKKTERVS